VVGLVGTVGLRRWLRSEVGLVWGRGLGCGGLGLDFGDGRAEGGVTGGARGLSGTAMGRCIGRGAAVAVGGRCRGWSEVAVWFWKVQCGTVAGVGRRFWVVPVIWGGRLVVSGRFGELVVGRGLGGLGGRG